MDSKPLLLLVFGLLLLGVFSGCTIAPTKPTGRAVSVKSVDFTPNKPYGLTATGVSGIARLSWSPPSKKVELYKVHRSLEGKASFQEIGELDLKLAQNMSGEAKKRVYSFVDLKVTKGIAYCYKIAAQITVNDKTYESAFSEPVCITVQ